MRERERERERELVWLRSPIDHRLIECPIFYIGLPPCKSKLMVALIYHRSRSAYIEVFRFFLSILTNFFFSNKRVNLS